jgi:hypothetical protein
MEASTGNEVRSTPYGPLYAPKTFGIQVIVLVAAFFGGPAIGWVMSLPLDSITPGQQLFFYAPPTLVFFLGYALWAARLATIAFNVIGKTILVALFNILIRRKKPERIEDILPSRDKLEQMVVRAQKAGWSFFTVGAFIGVGAGILYALVFALSGSITLTLSTLLWGYVLGRLARRGYLPLPESD